MNYSEKIASRGTVHYYLGLIVRWRSNLRYAFYRWTARRHGAIIGDNSVISWELAKKANSNLVVGDHCCISTAEVDLRAKVVIGNYVAISGAVRILNASHDINSPGFELKTTDLVIEDYVWLVGCLILPRVSRIGYGAVCGAGSVVTRDVPPMAVIGGNPGKIISQRKCVHDQYYPEMLNGGDFHIYREMRKKTRR